MLSVGAAADVGICVQQITDRNIDCKSKSTAADTISSNVVVYLESSLVSAIVMCLSPPAGQCCSVWGCVNMQ